jgi:hypothetical protein
VESSKSKGENRIRGKVSGEKSKKELPFDVMALSGKLFVVRGKPAFFPAD